MSHYKSSRNSGFGGSFRNWVRGGGIRPVAVALLFATIFIALPNSEIRTLAAASVPSTPSLGGSVVRVKLGHQHL